MYEDEIKVGDEVYYEGFGILGVVTHYNGHNLIDCIDSLGRVHAIVGEDGYVKTGRHFDQIAEMLNQMKYDKEER